MIVFPMAGLSRRFAEAGYTRPKYMLEAHGRSLFRHAVESFRAYFESDTFLFIYRDVDGTAEFVASECRAMGLRHVRAAALDAPTRGQAETVILGLRAAACPDAEPLLIFNIDTFRPGFTWPGDVDAATAGGYLEVFEGSGPNWSYVRPADATSNRVAETAEKREISRLCCTGLYHFARAGLFAQALAEQEALGPEALHARELYVAPLYNFLIRRGVDIRYHRIPREDVIFCGVPAEYDAFLKATPPA